MSAFDINAPLFKVFLQGITTAVSSSGPQQNVHFIARNFLLEERLDPIRVASYVAQLAGARPPDFAAWDKIHKDYLRDFVFLPDAGIHDYRAVDRNDRNLCPETFRAPQASISFKNTDFDTPLLRVVPLDHIAYAAEDEVDNIFALGEKVLADPHDTTARRNLKFVFDKAFFEGREVDYRPAFAAFYQDLDDELKALPHSRWANHLRNRLGLFHISQIYAPGLPRRVFMFKYKVSDLPKHLGEGDSRPLALPLVIDHKLFEAFCPAPREMNSGRTLNLIDGGDNDPVREVLHLRMPLQVEHLFAAGEVTERVSESLGLARRDHLILLQLLSSRDDYAADTDPDLLA